MKVAQYLYHLGALQLRRFLVANTIPGVTGSSGVFQAQTGTEETHRPAAVGKHRHSCQETVLCQVSSYLTEARLT